MAKDSGVRQGAEQGSVECRATGNRRGHAATVDSGVQGRVRSNARPQVRLKQRRHRQWAAQAATAPAKLGSSRLGLRQHRSRAIGAPAVGCLGAQRLCRAGTQGMGALRRLRRWCERNGMKIRGKRGGGGGKPF